MTHSQPAHTRSLPVRPNLVQLRKQAKELFRSYKAGVSSAVSEVEQFEAHADPDSFALADAQRVLARAYGFASWAKLKDHVEGLTTEAFLQAAQARDVDTIRRLASACPDLVNAAGGETGEEVALHFAVLNRDADMVRLLMKNGADARRGFWPFRSATTAFQLASDREYYEIVEMILQGEDESRSEYSAPGARIGTKTNEIAAAVLQDRDNDAIRMFESDPALIGASGNHGATPLHLAALRHNPEMVTWLIEHGAAVDAVNPYSDRPITYPASAGLGATPLDCAAMLAGWTAGDKYYGWIAGNEVFPYLENRRVPPERFDKTVDILRAHGARLTSRAAVPIGDEQAVRQMHGEGCLNVDIHLTRGGLLAVAVRVNRIDMVRLLLELGFDPDEPAARGDDGTRSWGFPLWFAALCGRQDIARLLLEHGADVDAIVCASGDPLGKAIATRDEPMQALLLEHGARFCVENLSDDGGKTARAILDGEFEATSMNFADPTRAELMECLLRSALGDDRDVNRMCLSQIERPIDDSWWAGLLHTTSLIGLKSLLEHGVHPDIADEGQRTALHYIASDEINGHMPDDRRLEHARLLLDAGASITRRDKLMRSTPLGWACRWGRLGLVELYLERGADPMEADAEPWATPLAWATKCGQPDILELLRNNSR